MSSCLLGERVRYHGGHAALDDEILRGWQEEGRLVLFCPEVAGGLPVPRELAELAGGDGYEVLKGLARVVDRHGRDVTSGFLSGAEACVRSALHHDVGLAVLKEGSPSCATGQIHDGSFQGATRSGAGVAAAALKRAGIEVFSEHELAAASSFLDELEALRAGAKLL